MSAGAGWTPPMCARCGKRWGVVLNRLIGGLYCQPCDDFITKPDPRLEQRYSRRVTARKAKEAAV